MSYDVTFLADMGLGEDNPALEDGWRNYTSNVSRMWSEAIREPDGDGAFMSLGELIEAHHNASDLLPFLDRGVKMMAEAPEFFRQWNPANGWGDYEGALGYLTWMRDRAQEWPTAYLHVWR